MIDHARLKAPPDSLGVLIEPQAERVYEQISAAASHTAGSVRILDSTVDELRASLRTRLGVSAPLIVSGHQAEFYHAGVFAKVVAAERIARHTGGSPGFITVDSDELHANALTVPQSTGGGLRRIAVAFTESLEHRTTERHPRLSRERWLDFFTRVASELTHYEESLLRPFHEAWLHTHEPQFDFCEAMERANGGVESALGLGPTQRWRISALARTTEFRAYAAHVMLDARRFAELYNAAQAAYRSRFKIRNAQRPVPQLAVADGRIELPFWLCDADGKRRRLSVARRSDSLELFADAQSIGVVAAARLETLGRVDDGLAQVLGEWELLPRALMLSSFARLLLADLFIHGIGGARYDGMTDDFVTRFFGAPPPPLACVTATLHLPLPHSSVNLSDVRAAAHRGRDIRFNPQRHIEELPAELVESRRSLVRQSQALRSERPDDHAGRRGVFDEIRRTNAEMLKAHPWRVAEMDQRVDELRRARQLDAIALDREYFFALHRKPDLLELIERIHAMLDRG